jgi:hypothetical protein
MKIIFSRKGFDTGSGGRPSPIIDGRPISLPIPTSRRSTTRYADLHLGELVERLTRGKVMSDSLCHDDPLFFDGKCAFGQTGAAQSHLSNNNVGVGDVFIFFGLFADDPGGEPHHLIYAYMLIEQIIPLGVIADTRLRPKFAESHPHFIGEWNANNTLYVGPAEISNHASPSLRLTQPGGPVSVWAIPPWLASKGLSYHGRAARWLPSNRLQTVARGQEFIADVGNDPDALAWVYNVMKSISRTPKSSDQNHDVVQDDETGKNEGLGAPKMTNNNQNFIAVDTEVDTEIHRDVLIVMLRQPRMNNPNEKRSDPFWEKGSFGCTGCHMKNLLNPKRASELEGVCLAFAQGGPNEIRLVHLTPPVEVIYHSGICELRWTPHEMPLKYLDAPIIINNNGHSDMPEIISEIEDVQRSTPVARFASKFRSRRLTISRRLSEQMRAAVAERRQVNSSIATQYEQALPFPPPMIDRQRAETYDALIREANHYVDLAG